MRINNSQGMGKCELFKEIANIIWDHIASSHRRGHRLSEVGFTANTVIRMIQDYVDENSSFSVFAQPARNEVQTGSDIELYIENGSQQFYRILLQAKIMETKGCFASLDRFSGSTRIRQYDSLAGFANTAGCDAYYLMYNGIDGYRANGEDCAGDYDQRQFGCAILNVGFIKNHCDKNNTGLLGDKAHPRPYGIPWRILACCDYQYSTGTRLYSFSDIDKDEYFDSLFTPPGVISFINGSPLDVPSINEKIHKEGWKPEARIIISQGKMMKGRGTVLGTY